MNRSSIPVLLLALCLGAASCTSSDGAASDSDASNSSSPADSAASELSSDSSDAGVAADDQSAGESSSEASVAVEIEVVSLNLYEGNAIVGELVVETSEATELTVTISGPGDPSPIHSPSGTSHRIALVGLRQQSEYEVSVSAGVHSEADEVPTLAGTLSTEQLPDEFPELAAELVDGAAVQPGLTLINLLYIPGLVGDDAINFEQVGWLLMVDFEGEIVWYHRADRPIGDARMVDDQTLLYEYDDMAARRVNLFGEVLDEWAGRLATGRLSTDDLGRQIVSDTAVSVDVDSMHHEQALLSDGTHATLSTELRVIDGFDSPQCGEEDADFDGSYHLIGDVITVFDPATGAILSEFSVFDYIDPLDPEQAATLCGLTQPFVFPNWMYQPLDPEARDWTHANGIDYDANRNALIVSIRHQSLVLAIRASDDDNGSKGDLLWSMGPGGNLELTNGEWTYLQHAPEVQDDGSILLFDNGAGRPGYATIFDPDLPNPFSRVVQYVVDDEAMTATQVWEYRPELSDEPIFSSIVGDADRLENGNVLMTNGALFNSPDGYSAQIIEVVPNGSDDGGSEVWHLDVLGGSGWIVYRAERVLTP